VFKLLQETKEGIDMDNMVGVTVGTIASRHLMDKVKAEEARRHLTGTKSERRRKALKELLIGKR
jgi:hypothetical protein